MYIPLVVFVCLTSVFSSPLKHDPETDIQVLALANVLEQLESAFYTQALQRFNVSSFEAAGYASSQIPIQQFQAVASDESTHAITLQSAIHALGGQIISNCTFNFSSALVNVETMVATARVVENVGVSAYLGALTSLADPALVTAAGSIMTVEARHQTILNLLSGATSIPQPFDVALIPADVLAIADSFISGCELGFSANPPLTVTNTGSLQAGTQLNFSSPALNNTTVMNQLSCEIVTGASNVSLFQPLDDCMAMKSSSKGNATMNSTVVAGPALLFVNQPDLIGNLIRPGLNTTGTTGGNHTTTSIMPSPVSMTSVATGTTSARSVATPSSAATTTTTPSPGVFTTTLSPAEASALMSSLSAN
ncbi:Ferritin-like domain containing protein [Tylopilus felleus]